VHRKQKGGDDAKPDREACMNSRPRRAIIVDAVQQIHPSRPTHALLLRRPRSDQLRTGHWNARALTGTCAGRKAICADGSARSFTAILADQRRQKAVWRA